MLCGKEQTMADESQKRHNAAWKTTDKNMPVHSSPVSCDTQAKQMVNTHRCLKVTSSVTLVLFQPHWFPLQLVWHFLFWSVEKVKQHDCKNTHIHYYHHTGLTGATCRQSHGDRFGGWDDCPSTLSGDTLPGFPTSLGPGGGDSEQSQEVGSLIQSSGLWLGKAAAHCSHHLPLLSQRDGDRGQKEMDRAGTTSDTAHDVGVHVYCNPREIAAKLD